MMVQLLYPTTTPFINTPMNRSKNPSHRPQAQWRRRTGRSDDGCSRRVGPEDVVQQFALLGARHVHIGGRSRALLIGRSGSGKTTMGVALAAALECSALVWDVSMSVESGWAGVDAGGALAELYQQCDRDLEVMARSVVVLDEIDKLACRDAVGNTRAHRQGQQKSLLGFLGGGVPLRFAESGDRGAAVSVAADDMLVIGSGVFEGLVPDAGPADLVALGFSAEFIS